MLKKLFRFLFAIFYLLTRYLFSFDNEKIIVSEGSKYNKLILITKCGSKRLMRFNNISSGAQSEIDLNRVDYPCVEYIQLMLISLSYFPYELNNKNILIIGLGGGILPRAIRKVSPDSLITIIEIDPLVNEMAKKYFYFKEDLKMKVIINDGRNYLNNLSNLISYDIIFFDAYDSISSLPTNMKTKEFFILLKNHLNINGGLIIFNLLCIYKSYFNIKQTINSIFGLNHLITFRSNHLLNIILLASTFNQHSTNINIIELIKSNLSIDVHHLFKRKQEETSNQNSSIEIYKDNNIQNNSNEEDISLTQFINLV